MPIEESTKGVMEFVLWVLIIFIIITLVFPGMEGWSRTLAMIPRSFFASIMSRAHLDAWWPW